MEGLPSWYVTSQIVCFNTLLAPRQKLVECSFRLDALFRERLTLDLYNILLARCAARSLAPTLSAYCSEVAPIFAERVIYLTHQRAHTLLMSTDPDAAAAIASLRGPAVGFIVPEFTNFINEGIGELAIMETNSTYRFRYEFDRSVRPNIAKCNFGADSEIAAFCGRLEYKTVLARRHNLMMALNTALLLYSRLDPEIDPPTVSCFQASYMNPSLKDTLVSAYFRASQPSDIEFIMTQNAAAADSPPERSRAVDQRDTAYAGFRSRCIRRIDAIPACDLRDLVL